MTGALPAVQEYLQQPLADAEVIIGTSAGSVLAAALRCGVTVEEMVAHQRGEALGVLGAATAAHDIAGGRWPRPPLPRIGSPRLVLHTLLSPHRVHPGVSASAWLPHGRSHHRTLHAMVGALHEHAHRHTAQPGPPPDWVESGQTWVVAVDYDSGRRVVFGGPGAPPAPLADAVVASCSIPGWYAPARIGGRRYIDGGVRSSTSARLLTCAGVDLAFVLAPLAATAPGRPRRPHEQLERRVRALLTAGLMREVRALESAGIRVSVLTPGPDDLAVMGVNLMDPRRCPAVLEASLHNTAAWLARQRRSRAA